MTGKLKEEQTLLAHNGKRLAVVRFDAGTTVELVKETGDGRGDMLLGRRQLPSSDVPLSFVEWKVKP